MENKYINPRFPHMIHGGDYNPEQWLHDKSIWEKDMELMTKANINELTVGIFSWAVLEPREGEFDFSFLDEIIDKIYANGGRVVLATPSGARPHWMADKYPEVLRVNKNLDREHFRGRHNHCYTSPVYREKVRIINTRLAERYGKHPAVIAWHLSNEYGGECYCPLCVEAFRDYLREKYDNDIEKLNLAYWSTFWSHHYDSFEQVEPPHILGENSIHALTLDWRRFVSLRHADFMRAEAETVRAICPEIPITTNMMPAFFYINYNDFAPYIDVASWDTYPDWHSPDSSVPYYNAFWNDFFRSLKQRPFMLMENCPGATNWKDINKIKRPGMDRTAALQSVAHGSDTVQYFQFRKSRGSSEKFHGAVVDHVGNDKTRVFRAVSDIGATLKAIDEVCGSMPDAKAAIIYDWDNRWALDDAQFTYKKDKKYHQTVIDYYRVLWERTVSVDVVGPHADLSKYELVIAPMLYLADGETIENLSSFVENGGTLYATYMLGMVNETDLCYLGGFPGGRLSEVFGIWNEEIDALWPAERVTVKDSDGEAFEGKELCELIHAEGAEVLAAYASEFYSGMPALTVNSYGKGRAYYQAFRDLGGFKDKYLGKLIDSLPVERALDVKMPYHTSAHLRHGEKESYLFVENYSGEARSIPLGREALDMVSGDTCSVAELSGFDTRIFKLD
jgi:beta-galactosidase